MVAVKGRLDRREDAPRLVVSDLTLPDTSRSLHLQARSRTTVMRLEKGPYVTASPALMGDLKALLGSSCLG